jgi:hypothetical protein
VVGESNALVLGGIGASVGMATSTPSNVSTIGEGAGNMQIKQLTSQVRAIQASLKTNSGTEYTHYVNEESASA